MASDMLPQKEIMLKLEAVMITVQHEKLFNVLYIARRVKNRVQTT